MFKCPKCNYENVNLNSMRIHCQKLHKIEAQEMYDLLVLEGKERPTCKCGCGEVPTWKGITVGYLDFIRGHHIRLEEKNPHKLRTSEALKRGGAIRSQKYKNGELTVWNKGLDKESDERIELYSKKSSETKMNDIEGRKQAATRMRENRLNGIVPTQKGESHSQWKGGVSPLKSYCNSNTRLFIEWKFPKLKESNFSCKTCGRTKNKNVKLCIHHDKERFADIVNEIAFQLGWADVTSSYTKEMNEDLVKIKENISNAVAAYHIQNNVSGIVLCEECHIAVHKQERENQ